MLIDVDKLPAEGAPIPTDANHMHFGKAQTEATIKLAPGKHTLQLELGDSGHMPFDPPIVSKKNHRDCEVTFSTGMKKRETRWSPFFCRSSSDQNNTRQRMVPLMCCSFSCAISEYSASTSITT